MLFSTIKERWWLGPKSDVPDLFLEPRLPLLLHLREVRQLAAFSAAPCKATWPAGVHLNGKTVRLKVHWGKISPQCLSHGRKNVTAGTSTLTLKSNSVSCWEICGIPRPRGRWSWNSTFWEWKAIHVIPSHSSTWGILLQTLETQHFIFFKCPWKRRLLPFCQWRKAQIEKPADVFPEPMMELYLPCPHLGL